MREKMARFLRGRYGMDQLSNCLIWIALLLLIIDLFTKTGILYYLSVAMMVYAYIRMFSRKYQKRAAQNRWFLERTQPIRNFFSKRRNRRQMKKTFHLCKCPTCKQSIRVPKGKGRLEVTCPKCRTAFTTKS